MAAVVAPSASPADRSRSWQLLVTDAGGVTLIRVEIPDGRFALRYRNSVYGTLAEERFVINADGAISLVGLAAEQPALLAEYYQVELPLRRAAAGATLPWEARPAKSLVVRELALAATELGERTLLVEGRAPIALWQLVGERSPAITLTARVFR